MNVNLNVHVSFFQPFTVELEWEVCFEDAHDGVDGEVEEEYPVDECELLHQQQPPGDQCGQRHAAVAAKLRQTNQYILTIGVIRLFWSQTPPTGKNVDNFCFKKSWKNRV